MTIKKTKQLTGSHLLILSLLEEGVTDIFGYPGGAIMPFYDVLTQYPELRHILVRNEQAAALAAIGYSRVTGHERIGVCVSTSGPGATNLVTGIYDAYMDSVPIVAITGQVPSTMVGTDAFQEADVIGITQPITKQNYFVSSAEDIPGIVKEAFYLARTGRPGPVVIDFPKDISNQLVDKFVYPKSVNLKGYKLQEKVNKADIRKAAAWLEKAKKPVILAGHGILISNAMTELMELASKMKIPVITTLQGLSSFPEDHDLSMGMLGMHGFAHANYAIQHCDVLLGIGLRFDDRILGVAEHFAPKAKIIHVDIDPAEIGKNVHTELPIVGDARQVLRELNTSTKPGDYSAWLDRVNKWKDKYPLFKHRRLGAKVDHQSYLTMRDVIGEINKQTKGDCIIASDVGQHQMITAQEFTFKKPHSHLTSGGSGTMGYGMPAAMGAKVARPEEEVWVIVGDGGIQMNLQEFTTLMQDQIAIKIAILNNGYLGMVRQWQELFFDKNYSSTTLVNPDFVKVAEACGLKAYRAKNIKEMKDIVKKMRTETGPVVCDFVVEREENVFPMVPAGKSLSETLTKK